MTPIFVPTLALLTLAAPPRSASHDIFLAQRLSDGTTVLDAIDTDAVPHDLPLPSLRRRPVVIEIDGGGDYVWRYADYTSARLRGSGTALRCGHRLVEPGHRRYRVAGLCGAPNEVSRRTVYTTRRYYGFELGIEAEQVVPIEIEEWIYDLGPTRLIRTLLFENGLLAAIEEGGRGLVNP